jgi:hypothetical protein
VCSMVGRRRKPGMEESQPGAGENLRRASDTGPSPAAAGEGQGGARRQAPNLPAGCAGHAGLAEDIIRRSPPRPEERFPENRENNREFFNFQVFSFCDPDRWGSPFLI